MNYNKIDNHVLTTRIRNRVVWHLWGGLCATPWCCTTTSWGSHYPEFWDIIPKLFLVVWCICWYLQSAVSFWMLWVDINKITVFFCILIFLLLNIIFWDASKLMFVAIFFHCCIILLHYFKKTYVRRKRAVKWHTSSVFVVWENFYLYFHFSLWLNFMLRWRTIIY